MIIDGLLPPIGQFVDGLAEQTLLFRSEISLFADFTFWGSAALLNINASFRSRDNQKEKCVENSTQSEQAPSGSCTLLLVLLLLDTGGHMQMFIVTKTKKKCCNGHPCVFTVSYTGNGNL